MKTLTILVISLAVLTACSNDLGNDTVIGRWGGADLVVDASRSTVTFTFPCGASVRVAHPLVVDAQRNFSIRDSLRGVYPNRDTLPNGPHSVVAALVSGSVSGDSMTVSVTDVANPEGFNQQFGARLGASSPLFGQQGCRV